MKDIITIVLIYERFHEDEEYGNWKHFYWWRFLSPSFLTDDQFLHSISLFSIFSEPVLHFYEDYFSPRWKFFLCHKQKKDVQTRLAAQKRLNPEVISQNKTRNKPERNIFFLSTRDRRTNKSTKKTKQYLAMTQWVLHWSYLYSDRSISFSGLVLSTDVNKDYKKKTSVAYAIVCLIKCS